MRVTSEDTIFSKDTIIVIYYNTIYQEINEVADDTTDTNKTEKVDILNAGDNISVTYTDYQKDDSENTINVPYIEITQ